MVSNDTSTQEPEKFSQEMIPQTRNGRLMFESKSDFHTYTEFLIENQNPSYLDKVEAGLKDFVSLRTATNQLIFQEGMDDGNQNNLRIVEDIVLESVLNSNGEIQIADSIFKITHDYVYMVDHQESDLLSDIYLRSAGSSNLTQHTSVQVFEIDRSVTSGTLPKSSNAMAIQSPGECWGYFPVPDNDDRKFRMKGSLWINNWWIYRSFGTELESQQIRKRGWFRRWFHNEAKFIKISGKFSVKALNSHDQLYTGTRHFNFTKSNAAEIRHTFRKDRNNEVKGANIQATFYVFKGATDKDHSTCSSTRSWRW